MPVFPSKFYGLDSMVALFPKPRKVLRLTTRQTSIHTTLINFRSGLKTKEADRVTLQSLLQKVPTRRSLLCLTKMAL